MTRTGLNFKEKLKPDPDPTNDTGMIKKSFHGNEIDSINFLIFNTFNHLQLQTVN